MLYREIIAVCFEIHNKYINTLLAECGIFVSQTGCYLNHYGLKSFDSVLQNHVSKVLPTFTS